MDKPLFWLASSLDDIRAFPDEARSIAGFQLRRGQQGLEPNDWKAMPGVGTGVEEVRIRTGREHRVFYVARFVEGIYVLHAFEKRSRNTAQRDLALGRSRYREMLLARRRG